MTILPPKMPTTWQQVNKDRVASGIRVLEIQERIVEWIWRKDSRGGACLACVVHRSCKSRVLAEVNELRSNGFDPYVFQIDELENYMLSRQKKRWARKSKKSSDPTQSCSSINWKSRQLTGACPRKMRSCVQGSLLCKRACQDGSGHENAERSCLRRSALGRVRCYSFPMLPAL